MSKNLHSGFIWITGLSAAGKTTIANIISKKLSNKNIKHVLMDGDVLRDCLDVQAHTRDDRHKNSFRYAKLARLVATQEGLVGIMATNALFSEVHQWNRENIPGYFEVFLNVPIDELKKRDPKGIYERFDKGEIKDVAGLDLDVDYPKNPDFELNFDNSETANEIADRILSEFYEFRKKNGLN